MAIHDVDPHSFDRSSPAIHAHDSQDVSLRMAHGTTSINPVTSIIADSGRIQTKNQQILVSDGLTNRAIIGFNKATGTWGVFTVPPGLDITEVTDPREFSLSSDLQTIISPKSGTITIPGGVSSAPGTDTFAATPIPHGLAYTPSIIGFTQGPVISNYPGGTTQTLDTLLPVNFYTSSLNVNNQLTIGTDATYIYAYNNVDFLIANPPISSWEITYYILNVTP